MSVLVFANGDVEDVEWIRPYLSEATAVIAADGGTRHLMRLNHVPDVVIGDMDSLPEEARSLLASADVQLLEHPQDKDETDLELALLHAVTRYAAEDILLFGVLGGRLDQLLANIMLLAHPALDGRRVVLVNQYERAWLVSDGTWIEGSVGDRISLIPLGGDVRVAHTDGLRWPLQDEILAFGPARGVSNVMTESIATIVLQSGRLLCVHTSQSWQR